MSTSNEVLAAFRSQGELIFRRGVGAHGVTRPTFSALVHLGNTPSGCARFNRVWAAFTAGLALLAVTGCARHTSLNSKVGAAATGPVETVRANPAPAVPAPAAELTNNQASRATAIKLG